MKKTLSILVVLVVLLTGVLLTGCGKTQKTDWDYIQSKGEMTIGITYYQPMNYLDANGNLTGFDTEFAEAVCQKLGITPKFQEIDWDSKETELDGKTIDCIWNGMTKTPERAQNMDLSESYMNDRQVMVVPSSRVDLYQTAADLAGKEIVAEKGSASESAEQSDSFFAQGKYTAVDKEENALMEVKAGTADAAVCDYVMAAGSLGAGSNFTDLVISPYWTAQEEEYSIAFRKNSPETLAKINEAIDELKADGTLESIAAKYNITDLLIK